MDVSVIIPVYNVEKYLDKCIESLITQKFKDEYEIILIDDGSTDNSGEICDTYGALYKKVKVYHTKNKGVSEARNLGIKKAEGKYITFVDPDDYVGENYINTLYTSIVENEDVQISVLKFKRVKEDYVLKEGKKEKKIEIIGKLECLKRIFARHGMGVSPCGKMYEKNLFLDIKFPQGKFYEDLLTIPYIIEKSKKVAVSNNIEYYYLIRPGSTTETTISKKESSYFSGLENIGSYFSNRYPMLIKAIQVRYVKDSINYLNRLIIDPKNRDSEIEKVKQYISEKSIGLFQNKESNIKLNMQVLVLKMNTKVYKFIIKKILSRRS